MYPSDLASRISEWIRERVNEAGAQGVVLGMSGGLDSSVTAVLCKKAFPDTTLGLIMPCGSRKEDVEHARIVAKKFGIETKEIDLSHIFTVLLKLLEVEERENDGDAKGVVDINIDIAVANLKPRLRMICLYYFANKRNYLVVGTGNKSELSIGYFTKYGDGAADILPLGDVLKTEERRLAEELVIPGVIIEKVPSAGLWEGQTDEAEIGMGYDVLDKIILALERGNFGGCDPELVERVKRMMAASQHKRETIPVFKQS
ncbi:MAG TPA: NAD(+) synthase [Candidatus Bathyarchaeia archaeon]|nr:NAD(+) synthase [Candidatus Bathyarchaeia archaeon]